MNIEFLDTLVVDLQELLNNQTDDSSFDWRPIVVHIVKKIGVEDIYTLAALFEHNWYASQLLAIFSKKLSALGEIQGAWSLGEQALNASQAHGWLRWYDGGGRLAAFQALAQVNPIRTRPLVYDSLVRDLTGEFWYPQNLALELDEILPLLTDKVPAQAIWPVIEQYVHTLFEGCSFSTDSPELAELPSHDNPSRAITDLLILHIDHPVDAIAQASQRACAKLLLQRDSVMQDAVCEGLEKTESQQEHILRVLDAISLHNPNALAPLRHKILSLHKSTNYAIRRAAQTIGKRIGCERTITHAHPMPLPAIYKLSFLRHRPGGLIDPEAIREEEPLPDSNDPVNIIRPLGPYVDLIVEKARLPKVNMYHRTVQIMQQLAPHSSWSEDGEKQLRAILDSAGLRLTFDRPRAVLARRAVFYIIAELIDANILGPNELSQLERVLRFYDPHMLLREPTQRPSSVPPLEGKDRFGGVNEKWPGQVVETADSVCCRTDDGLIVLAEETTLKWLEWGTPTEVRHNVVVRSRVPYPEDTDSFFSETANCSVSEYPFLST